MKFFYTMLSKCLYDMGWIILRGQFISKMEAPATQPNAQELINK